LTSNRVAANNHRVDVENETRKVVTYRVEVMAPNGLYRAGWTKNS